MRTHVGVRATTVQKLPEPHLVATRDWLGGRGGAGSHSGRGCAGQAEQSRQGEAAPRGREG